VNENEWYNVYLSEELSLVYFIQSCFFETNNWKFSLRRVKSKKKSLAKLSADRRYLSQREMRKKLK